jgi:amino acid adenylation domain-containing protein
MTYAELEAQANRLAHWLVGQGVVPGDRIGLCIGRDRRLPAMMLAALKAGAVYVPLDANYPSSRLRFMLEDVAARLVVADAAHFDLLPEGSWRIVETAAAASEAANDSNSPLRLSIDAGAVSHIMYTSGSTGKPKGMGMPHRIASRLVLGSDYVQLSASDRIAQVASVSFDAATFEIWGALLNGARIVFIPRQVALEPLALAAALREQGVTVMFLTTALFNQMAQTVPDAFAAMHSVLFGGERVNPDAVRRVLAARAPRQLLHVYGPTENGVFSTWYRIAHVADNAQTIPIGKPIANSRAYLLDAGRRLCPPGVPGEIYVGGDGLAVGYIGRDDLTDERFVDVQIDGEPVRLYRTGDLARYLPGGDIEFVARIDNQVKIRGFRIEPGEIEAHAKRHPAVRDVVVAPRPGPAGLQLVAYVVPQDSAEETTAALEAEHAASEGAAALAGGDATDEATDAAADQNADQAIDQVRDWHALYHDTYATLAQNDDPRLSFTGWNSSYTGGPIDPNEMREWAENAAGRILALQPKRILEIGCGSGLLLFRIAPQVERYRAVDFSQSALDYVRSKLHVVGEHADKVSLHQGLADEIGQCEERGFDTVILNSIVQYFPRAQYLADVIGDVLPLLAPGGRIFLGDLRNHNLRRMFAASIERVRADDAVPVEELRRRTTQRLLHDGELLVAPEFFHLLRRRLPGIGRIEVMPKYAADDNELTKYRYDVVLHLADAADAADTTETAAETRWLDWDAERLSLDAVEAMLAAGPHSLALAHVPNAKLAEDRAALLVLDAQTAGEQNDAPTDAAALRTHAAHAPAPSNYEAFQALAAAHGYRLAVSWARCGEHGAFDLYFDRVGAPAPFPAPQVLDGPLERYTNLPLRNRLYAQLIPSLKAALANALPDYMVPSAYVLMDAIPLNANGKTDLAALPAPEGGVPEGRAYVAPRTEWERIVAGVWRDVLGIERIGIEDNFFALGGHSLMATQVMSRLQKRLELPSDLAYTRFGVRALFEAPSLAQLAQVAEQVANEYRVFVADDADSAEDVGETEEFVL